MAADAKTLVVASGADAVTLDPQVSFDGQSPLLWRAVYENLLTYDGDTLDIVPHLAESYDVSDDGLTYTFKIRSGRDLQRWRAAQRGGGEDSRSSGRSASSRASPTPWPASPRSTPPTT